MKNYYELLGIDRYSTPKEIKKGYNKSVRKYPPETEPQKYMEIREAYEILTDETSRDKYNIWYDKTFEQVMRFQALKNSAVKSIKEKEYGRAKTILKKILLLNPNNLEIKKLLSDVFFYQGYYTESLNIINELITQSPKPVSEYYFCRGRIYFMLYNKISARNDFTQAYLLDTENYRAITYLVNLNLTNKRMKEAIDLLKAEINGVSRWSISKFVCFLNLMICYILKDDKPNLNAVIKSVEKIAPNDIDTKNYMCRKLAKLATSTAIEGYGITAMKVVDLIKKINPSYSELNLLESKIELYKKTEMLVNDTKFDYLPIKEPIVYSIYNCRIPKKYYDNAVESIKNDLNTVNKNMLNAIKNSISYLKSNYRELFDSQKELYATFNDLLKKQLILSAEYDKFFNDPNFVVTFKKCINEMENYHTQNYDKAFRSLKKILDTTIRKNLNNFEKYPKLKERYSDFILKLESILNNNQWPTVKVKTEKKGKSAVTDNINGKNSTSNDSKKIDNPTVDSNINTADKNRNKDNSCDPIKNSSTEKKNQRKRVFVTEYSDLGHVSNYKPINYNSIVKETQPQDKLSEERVDQKYNSTVKETQLDIDDEKEILEGVEISEDIFEEFHLPTDINLNIGQKVSYILEKVKKRVLKEVVTNLISVKDIIDKSTIKEKAIGIIDKFINMLDKHF